MNPTLNIFGIQETNANKNKFVPHYKILANKLYSPSRLTLFNPKSVMFTRQAFDSIDFWNSDSDFFFAEDALSYNELLNFSSNHTAYFQGFLKVMRIAHSIYQEDLLDCKWTKNKAHVLDIISSAIIADVVMVSPVLRDMLLGETELPRFLSKTATHVLEKKMLVLPPPDFYKFEGNSAKKTFKKLTFLWNHRLNAVKNPKLFFSIVDDFHKKYPSVPISIIVMSSLQSKEVLASVPTPLHKFIDQRPFAFDDTVYEKALMDANVTIGTSSVESYGISILETAKYGSAVFNLPCNKAFASIVGNKSTFRAKDIPDKLYRLHTEPQYGKTLIAYTNKGLATITSAEQYTTALTSRLQKVFSTRLERTSTKSPKLAAVMAALDKKALSKQEVYAVMGWNDKSRQPVNTFWSDYYYGLRKLGVQTSVTNGVLHFYTSHKPKAKDGAPK